jgi:hypothetical protein
MEMRGVVEAEAEEIERTGIFSGKRWRFLPLFWTKL